ncbi:hypothetical protein [Caulobacter sp. S45]|uniref:hypothetical protein n=1 Tax=Caulobacter sp. S45 TaxID=1641861 RepID=UPI001576C144|nr:hypothetical protein [Caulobacter sp. S45]
MTLRAPASFAPAVLAGMSVLALLSSSSSAMAAAPRRPQTTPLDDAHLFVSPMGQPFRSVSGQPYPVVQWFKAADANHDGKLDKVEFKADAQAFFTVLDRNRDGLVTDSEIVYYETVLVPELNASGQAAEYDTSDKTKLAGDLQGAAPYALINDAEPVRSADDSFIGRLTLKAFLARADHNFDVLDERSQGYLVLEELPRTQVQDAAQPAKRAK